MKPFHLVKTVALVAAAIAAWAATAVLGLMCLFSVVLGPLVLGIFPVAAVVGALALYLSALAAEGVAELWRAYRAAARTVGS